MAENLHCRPVKCSVKVSFEGSECGAPNTPDSKLENRRGRPKAAMITNLMIEGATSRSGIRCEVCSRVFPRDKSLQAHMRVHTGERPYPCDFPGCMRRFKQSGQLKTHQRLHTGERPFICSFPGCSSRFTHSNRHCHAHPNAQLMRSDDSNLLDATLNHQSEEVTQWLLKYKAEKRESKCEKRSSSGKRKCEEEEESMVVMSLVKAELSDVTNLNGGGRSRVDGGSPLKGGDHAATALLSPPSKRRCLRSTPVKSALPSLSSPPDSAKPAKNLFSDDKSPRKRELPKKRWLRIASREQESFQIANLMRPTVLRHVGSFTPPQSTSTPCRSCPLTTAFLTPPYSVEKSHTFPPSPADTLPSDDDVLAVPLNSSLDLSFT